MSYEAYTVVAVLCKGGEKGEGGWVYATRAMAEADLPNYPPGPWALEVRRVVLPGPLATCATRLDHPGRWELHKTARLDPHRPPTKAQKTRPRPQPAPQVRSLFD